MPRSRSARRARNANIKYYVNTALEDCIRRPEAMTSRRRISVNWRKEGQTIITKKTTEFTNCF